MKMHSLTGTQRTIVGRKVATLRKAGELPATIYGKKRTSKSISVNQKDFAKIFAAAGETGVVELSVGNEKHPVLIHNVQLDPVVASPLHVEFYQVDLHEKVRTKVPLTFVGEAPAVLERRGVLLTLLAEVEVEALPTELPEKLELDVSSLADVDQELTISAIHIPAGVTLLTDKALGAVKVAPLVSKEAEAQAAAEAAAAAAAATAAPEGTGETTAQPAADVKQETVSPEKAPEEKK